LLINQTVAFLGAGSMAEAMIAGLVRTEKIPSKQIFVTNRSNQERLQELQQKYMITGKKIVDLDFSEIDIFILAMKPKDVERALHEIKGKVKPGQLVISVAAGISASFIEQHLPKGQPLIRIMPNTSSMIGESATAISPGQNAGPETIKLVKELLSCIGTVFVIEEDQMDIFTGIAGSGPAYFYYLIEYIEKAGKEGGLDADTARQISAQTILGAAKMIMHQNITPAQLRENVTSPNGTTAAGLEALKKHGGGTAIFQAVKGAAERSKEISCQLHAKF
jgi:pyrroline-5-carboxylate reductase